MNLLSNAVKFTKPGGSVESILTEKDAGDYLMCTIIVRDNGIGMNKEFLPKVFDAYTQEERSSSSKTVGTGLGMAIVKEIVDLMGGAISVESELDVGTTFTVNLKLKKHVGTIVLHPIASPAKDVTSLQGKQVLLCEDNELNAEIAQLLLQAWGMEVTWAENGQQAVEAIKDGQNSYDIILMDKRMPVMDGITATRAIRSWEEGSDGHILIIAMTGDVDETSVQACLAAGMDGHVGKPIDRDELARTMMTLLD